MTRRYRFSFIFFLKKTKSVRQKGSMFIYARITLNGLRAEFATGHSCTSESWQSKIGLVKADDENADKINDALGTIKKNVLKTYDKLLKRGSVTASGIKAQYLGSPEVHPTIMEALNRHNTKMAALVSEGLYATGTHKRFEILKKYLGEFLRMRFRLWDMDVTAIDYEFIEGFEFFLLTAKSNGRNTANKHLKNFRKILVTCIRYGWIDRDPFAGKRYHSDPVKRTHLSTAELHRIATIELDSDKLIQVRDFFLFSCYTGLSYLDLQQLLRSDIHSGADGRLWIFTYRKKTGTRLAIPLLPPAAAILARYTTHKTCSIGNKALPLVSNQKMNQYLIEVADQAKVNKILGNRVAKRTFATTVTLLNGVPIESVSKMLGHTSIRTTQLYAEVLDEKVGEDMERIMEKF